MSDYYGQGSPYPPPGGPPVDDESRVNAGRLWAGGFGAAVVAALVIVVGILLIRGVFGIPVLSPESAGAYGTANTTNYALAGAAAALLATAALHILLLFMPSPMTFFYWIGTLLTAVAVLVPFTFAADTAPRIATAILNLIVGFSIVTVLGSVAAGSVRYPRG
ncbi:DUF6069 family protein [Nocardia sp. NPDC050406]|uniref:DUF6069 family protein n=1 Tax=Nocardia sp. NPDC050406 TaxID=3364318 RepID=UPI0037A90AFA